MKRLILCGLILLGSASLSAQLSIGYFPFQSELSLSTNTGRNIYGDLRMATNTFFGNMTVEPIFMLNLKKEEMINYYGGIGMNVNFFNAADNISVINGFSLHIGIRAKPIKQLNNLHFLFEVSPYMNRHFDGGILRTRMGVAYQFSKRRKP